LEIVARFVCAALIVCAAFGQRTAGAV
jgi:hypothetical protein